MKNFFFISKLDFLSLTLLLISKNIRNSKIFYFYKSKIANITIKTILKYRNIETEIFSNKLFEIKDESAFYTKNKQVLSFSKEINGLISKGLPLTYYVSKNINVLQSKQIIQNFLALDVHQIISFINYSKYRNKNNEFNYFICLHLHDLNLLIKKNYQSPSYDFINISNVSSLLLTKFIKFFFQIILQFFYNFIPNKKLKNQENDKEKKIAICYLNNLDSPFSNHWWLKKINIKKSNIIFYFNEYCKVKATDEVIEQIKSKGYSVKIVDKKLNNTSFEKTERIYINFNNLFLILKRLFLLFYNYKKINLFSWQLSQWLTVAFKTEYHKSFIKNNNIYLIFDYAETNKDIIALSAMAANIKKIYYQRSDIYFPNFMFNPLHDYFFTWGDLAKNILSTNQNNKNTKFINIGNTFYSYPNINFIKDTVIKKIGNSLELDSKTNIAIFDRSNGHFSYIPLNEHINFFNEVLKLAELDQNINLLIKPKQKIKDEILNSFKIRERISELKITKQIFIFNPSDTFYEAVIVSDITFSLGLNTAGIQGAIANVTPFFWDPLALSKSYNDLSKIAGYGNSFFTSDKLETIIKNLKFYIKNKKNHGLEFSNNYKLLRNHFNDDKAVIRISKEIDTILNNYIDNQ